MTTAIAESLSTGSLDLETLMELSQRADSTGVLSIYVDARPGALRATSIDLKNRLAQLERQRQERLARPGACGARQDR